MNQEKQTQGARSQGAGETEGRAVRPAQCERLARTLRELRSATGLSLAALAARTPYSKSSWERYLNGKALPPRQAVEQLCRLAGERQDRPLALWELAESAWSGRSGVGPAVGDGTGGGGAAPGSAAPAGVPPAPPGLPDRRHHFVRRVAGALAGCAVVAAGVLMVTWGFGSGDSDAKGAASPSRSAAGPSCFGDACTGRNPESTGCSNAAHPAGTLAERRFDGGTVVKVRRSVRCGTVWARIDRGREGDRVEITAPGIGPQQSEVRDRFDEEGSLSTPMAAANPRLFPEVESCLVRDGARHCFPVAPGS
ncbi:helix-turn-helix domain-containing protein [Streptomyces sp. NPDC006285]|uniref:helix-turn-helix domain-containing protein n=1 Tax=Streptomyces sp. NPDC006285 TaxID=3364742 RepID=UPI0036A47E0E